MIYFIAYIVLMFIFAGIFCVFDDSKVDNWFWQAAIWPLMLLFFIGINIGKKLK